MNNLKSLTLSGFKSFGKTTVFEFPAAVTAIVGPNGSGKSNVAEALRWVLGEQSMKSLRGKRGEDLIFNGSDKAARLGRAEVKLIFDNSRKQFPYEFEEVIISRRVLRDGVNEYILNGSPVRLKDIFELLSRVGLGATQHHIISQGEVDRILWANPLERQEMIEEALGLKEYHLKIRDAERKLTETETNMKQVEAQRRELEPHLKFLRTQADKMKAHEEFKQDLDAKLLDYASREQASLDEMGQAHDEAREPLLAVIAERDGEIKALTAKVQEEEKEFSNLRAGSDTRAKLEELEMRATTLNRELGRVEGQIASVVPAAASEISAASLLRDVKETISFVDELMRKDSFEAIKSGLKDIKLRLEEIVRPAKGSAGANTSLEEKKSALVRELRGLEEAIRELTTKRKDDEEVREDILTEIRDRERELRDCERERDELRDKLREVDFRQGSLKTRRDEFTLFLKESHITPEPEQAKVFSSDADRLALLRAIERLRIKLEEAGGIDSSVVKEFEDTRTRTEYLAGELDDLSKAKKTLMELMRELDHELREHFKEGLKKINNEFQIFFKTIFGGGKASVTYMPPMKDEEGNEVAGGVEIAIDIPRKRLRSLDMLSGGERALTSVALLFAMSAVNPPPFLVLDETDAALDEANSQRYGALLAELSEKTQLLVITHNRQTMERADVLYGVTMSNDGVSKILSLKFEEAKEYAKESV